MVAILGFGSRHPSEGVCEDLWKTKNLNNNNNKKKKPTKNNKVPQTIKTFGKMAFSDPSHKRRRVIIDTIL